MILDYKNNKEFLLENGIMPENNLGETHFVVDKIVRDITFKNFFNLCIEDMCLENCSFENCHCVTIENAHIERCTFKNVDSVASTRVSFENCTFSCCCSDGAFLSIDSGSVENCVFDTITTLGEDGYVIDSVYGKKHEVEMIKNCKFVDCQVESEDGKLCNCCYFKPFSSSNTVAIDNIDYDTCDLRK
jgi:hypothetical protein